MKLRHLLLLTSVVTIGAALLAQAPPAAAPAASKMKHLLAIGDVRSGFQHDSVSHALATIDRLGYESGIMSRTSGPTRSY